MVKDIYEGDDRCQKQRATQGYGTLYRENSKVGKKLHTMDSNNDVVSPHLLSYVGSHYI